MTILGLPLATFVVFVATVVAGSIGAAHYAYVHAVRDEPFEGGEGASWR